MTRRYSRHRRTTRASSFTGSILVGAVVLGLAGGTGSTFLSPSSSPGQSTGEQDWTPRHTINPQTLMSAADLDQQQPSSAAPAASAKEHPTSAGSSGWSYRSCREARAAGAAPLYRGQPGYGAHMDGDSDGIACEPYRGR